MTKITAIDIRCLNCREWFPSPVFFGDLETLISNLTTITENKAQCHHCHELTSCNRENMRVKSEDGGFRGLETA